jgi:Flp pilus assembly protein TadD
MSAIDELLATWRSNPNAPLTIALCSALAHGSRGDVVREVGTTADTWHAQDIEVMLAVGRMYLGCGLLTEAQTALVGAGKLDGQDPRSFRLLGETLLRRGDAVRAERVLNRARSLGATDAGTLALTEQLEALVALQKRSGMQAVANQVKRLLSSRPPPTAPARASVPAGEKLPLPRFESEDPIEISEVYERETAAGGQGARSRPPRAAQARSVNAPKPADLGPKRRAAAPSADEITNVMGDNLARVEEASVVDISHLAEPERLPSFDVVNGGEAPRARSAAPAAHGRRGPAVAPAPPAPLRAAPVAQPAPSRAPVAAPAPLVAQAPAAAPVARAPVAPFAPTVRAEVHAAPQPLSAHAPQPLSAHAPLPAAHAPLPAALPQLPHLDEEARQRYDETVEPPPSLIFEHLARVGVFEPSGGAPPAWEAAPRQKSRGVIPLVLASVLLSAAGVGGYEYARRLKVERAQQATALNAEVKKFLHTAKLADLRSTDAKLSRAFDLDSRSQVAGRLWLENRVLGALLLPDEPRGIDSAVHRGRAVGLPEKELAVGRIASFLVDGDLAGAAAQLPKWDAESGNDALYQLAAGAALERAGDARAIERYTAARDLDPKLIAADLLRARLLLLEYGPERGRPVIQELEQKGAEPLAVRALSALAWVVDPERSPAPPESARIPEDDARRLPAPLAAIPDVVAAVEGMISGDEERATKALERAISLSHGPALPTTLGFLAIQAGNEALARKAALRALSFAALYPRARTLAARVALLGGRLDEAQKAVEELDPKSSDVAVVRAVVAYETGEVSDLDGALAALGPIDENPALAALAAAPGVLAGTRLLDAKALAELASPAVPWGRLVAIDTALDSGNLALAAELAGPNAERGSPVDLLRVARLRRYEKKPEQALAASEAAFAGKPTLALIVERTYDLLDAQQVPAAKDLVAKYPTLLGPVSGWLGVLVDAASAQPQKAALRLTKLDPPPDEAPTFLRVLVARALAAGGDKRARPYVFALARRLPRHPDVILAAEALK